MYIYIYIYIHITPTPHPVWRAERSLLMFSPWKKGGCSGGKVSTNKSCVGSSTRVPFFINILKSWNQRIHGGKKRLLLGKKGKLLSASFSVHPEFISVHQPGSGSGVESFDFSLLFSIFTNNGKTWGKKNNITLKCNSNDYLNLRWTIIRDDHHIDARCPEDDEQMQML